ncbi:MAG: hypothetical protein ACUVWP_06990 [bacterium]
MINICIFIFIILLSISTTAVSSDKIAQTKCNPGNIISQLNSSSLSDDIEIRFDDGSYENAINWYSQYMTHYWDGWGKLFTAENFGKFRIRKIKISFQMFKGYNTPPREADFDLAICPPALNRKPMTGAYLWRQNFPPPEKIEPYPKWSTFEYEVPEITSDKNFFVLWLPGWGGNPNIDPDPPILFCVDENNWKARSYGNLEGTYDWVLLKDIGIRGEFGIAVYGIGYSVGIESTSLGQIKSIFR